MLIQHSANKNWEDREGKENLVKKEIVVWIRLMGGKMFACT